MLVGRLNKDTADVRRVTVDFATNGWLDTNEVIATFSPPGIVIEQYAVWQQGANVPSPPPPPPDTTPLVLVASFLLAGSQVVQLMLGAGTPGLTYKVSFVATGSTSGRQKQIDILVNVREPV